MSVHLVAWSRILLPVLAISAAACSDECPVDVNLSPSDAPCTCGDDRVTKEDVKMDGTTECSCESGWGFGCTYDVCSDCG